MFASIRYQKLRKAMENLHNHYPYLPLEAVQDEIRLLELVPGGLDSSTRIQARVIHRSLKQSPNYDALSYVWGRTHDQATIILDGREYVVTANLEWALRHVSHFEARKNESGHDLGRCHLYQSTEH